MMESTNQMVEISRIFEKYDFSEEIASDLLKCIFEAPMLFETCCSLSQENYIATLIVFMMRDPEHCENIRDVFMEVIDMYAATKNEGACRQIKDNMFRAMNIVHTNEIVKKLWELYDTTEEKQAFFNTLNFVCKRF